MLLNQSQLSQLRRTLRDELVLSIYLGHAVADPAQRNARLAELRRGIVAAREHLAGRPRLEIEAFERSMAQLDDAVERGLQASHGLAFAGFATADRVWFAASVPAPMPTMVRWQRGMHAGPYVRALKQHRVAVIAIIDGISCRLYRYMAGTLLPVGTVKAHPRGGHADHLGSPPRPGFHPGTRGASAADLGARGRVAARERVADQAAGRVAELVGDDGYLIIGGSAGAAHVLLRAIPEALARRTRLHPELGTRASEAAIRLAAERGASALRAADDEAMVSRLLEDVGGHGAAVSGAVATLDVLGAGRAHVALLTDHFLNAHPDQAEEAIELALDHGTTLEIVTGAAAERLDAAAGGIAAELRFVMHPSEPLAEMPD